MASSIASLFGPTAEEIVYAKQQENELRKQQLLQQGLAMQSSPLAQQYYQAGYNIVSGLGGMFGPAPMQDPRLGQSVKIRQILGSTDVSDLNDTTKVKALSKKFAEAGLGKEALYFADRATSLESLDLERAKLNVRDPDSYWLTRSGNPVEKDAYQNYYDMTTGQRIPKADLIPSSQYVRQEKESVSGKEPSEREKITIEQTFLEDTDFDEQTKSTIASFINQLADVILKEEGFKGKTQVEAQREAWRRIQESGVVRRDPPRDFFRDIDAPFAPDWVFEPERLNQAPLAPVISDDGDILDFRQLGK